MDCIDSYLWILGLQLVDFGEGLEFMALLRRCHCHSELALRFQRLSQCILSTFFFWIKMWAFWFGVWFWGRMPCSPGWSWTCYIAKDNLELPILFSLPPECWDDSICTMPHFWGAGEWIQGFLHARQALNQLSYILRQVFLSKILIFTEIPWKLVKQEHQYLYKIDKALTCVLIEYT